MSRALVIGLAALFLVGPAWLWAWAWPLSWGLPGQQPCRLQIGRCEWKWWRCCALKVARRATGCWLQAEAAELGPLAAQQTGYRGRQLFWMQTPGRRAADALASPAPTGKRDHSGKCGVVQSRFESRTPGPLSGSQRRPAAQAEARSVQKGPLVPATIPPP